MNKKWIALRCAAETAFTLFVTHAAMKWASHMAYMERGYMALGGELIFAGLAAYAAYKAIDILFEQLEEERYADRRKRKKRRSGRTARLRNHR